jgi:hypothetical protein
VSEAIFQVLLDNLSEDENGRLIVNNSQTRQALFDKIMATHPEGILQPWVARMGLRHQGCVLSSVRGCDTAPKDDPSKRIQRLIRGAILRPHCGDASKAVSFIQVLDDEQLEHAMTCFVRGHDQYPNHYVLHVMHAAEIIGYYQNSTQRALWFTFYTRLCKSFHVTPETREQLDKRLNKDEQSFGKDQAA